MFSGFRLAGYSILSIFWMNELILYPPDFHASICAYMQPFKAGLCHGMHGIPAPPLLLSKRSVSD